MNRSSEPVSGAGLDGEGAEDGTGDGDKVLGYLDDFVPIDFHFTQNKFKRNTLLIKGHTDYTDFYFSDDSLLQDCFILKNKGLYFI